MPTAPKKPTPAKKRAKAPKKAAEPTKEPLAPELPPDLADELEKARIERRARFERWKAWSNDPAAIEELCDFAASGGAEGSLRAFAIAKGFPYQTLRSWLEVDAERARKYRQACDFRADCMADEILAIADEPPERDAFGKVDPGSVRDKQLRIDARKWAASKLLPRRYGDKVAIGGAEDLPPVQTDAKVTLSPAEAYKRLIGGA